MSHQLIASSCTRFTDEPDQRSPCQRISIHLGITLCNDHVPWRMIVRHFHVESAATVAQVFGCQHGALLTNEQRSAVGVAADVVRTDGQIGNLQALDAVDIEALVEDAVLDDAVALLGSHGARAQGVPGGLDVAL